MLSKSPNFAEQIRLTEFVGGGGKQDRSSCQDTLRGRSHWVRERPRRSGKKNGPVRVQGPATPRAIRFRLSRAQKKGGVGQALQCACALDF